MIQELKTNLTIGDNGRANLTTSLVKGKLSAFIVRTASPIKLGVVLENYPSISLLDLASCNGEKYFPIEVQPQDNKGDAINYRSNCYYLNDKLIIEAAGVRGAKIEVIIRYE